MRFYNDSTKTILVDWYEVPADRPVLPFAHAFGSAQFDKEHADVSELGEQRGPITWRNCAPPCDSSSVGLCGSEADWVNGVSIDAPGPAFWPNTRTPVCCGRPDLACCGGLTIGRGPCGLCEVFIPSCPGLCIGEFVRIEITSLIGPTCPNLVGTYYARCRPGLQRWIGNVTIAGQPVEFDFNFQQTHVFGFWFSMRTPENYTESLSSVEFVCEPFSATFRILVGPTFFPILCAGGIFDTFVTVKVTSM